MAVDEPIDWAQMEREHAELLQAILTANQDLAVRVERLGVTMEYDEELDLMFMMIGSPVEAFTESADNRIGLRVDPDTLKLVGLEILDFRRSQAGAQVLPFMLHALTLTGALNAGQPGAAENARERLAEDFRELVAV